MPSSPNINKAEKLVRGTAEGMHYARTLESFDRVYQMIGEAERVLAMLSIAADGQLWEAIRFLGQIRKSLAGEKDAFEAERMARLVALSQALVALGTPGLQLVRAKVRRAHSEEE